jgi:hypothetical protein
MMAAARELAHHNPETALVFARIEGELQRMTI